MPDMEAAKINKENQTLQEKSRDFGREPLNLDGHNRVGSN